MSESLDTILLREYLKALRSGEYSQCRGAPHRNGAHCAIGLFEIVYENIIGENPYRQKRQKGSFRSSPYSLYRHKFGSKYGISEHEIFLRNDGDIGVRKQYSFEEIADYIEERIACQKT